MKLIKYIPPKFQIGDRFIYKGQDGKDWHRSITHRIYDPDGGGWIYGVCYDGDIENVHLTHEDFIAMTYIFIK